MFYSASGQDFAQEQMPAETDPPDLGGGLVHLPKAAEGRRTP